MPAIDEALYLDTNLLIATFVPETGSRYVGEWLSQQRGDLYISLWTLVEFASALGLKVRERFLTKAEADSA